MSDTENNIRSHAQDTTAVQLSVFLTRIHRLMGPGYLSRYSDSLQAGTVQGSNSGGGEIFRTRPDRPWGPPSLLYNGYRVSFSGVKRPGRGVDHPPYLAPRLKKE